MFISKFTIENFKGISSTTIEISRGSPGNIITLVGLNESGKTTILEALSFFFTEDGDTVSLVESVQRRPDLQALIPKSKKAAFTGKISIAAHVELEDSDVSGMMKHLKNNMNIDVDPGSVSRTLKLDRAYEFEDSLFKNGPKYWNLRFRVRADDGETSLVDGSEAHKPAWLAAIEYLKKSIPVIVYFPTFLFNFPDKIYLENTPEEDSYKNSHYLRVMQDVLDAQGEGLSLAKHVQARIARLKEVHITPLTFFSYLLGTDEKSQIDSVLQKLSNEISKEVLGAWRDILGKSVNNKRIQVDWTIDSVRDNAPYFQLSIIDGLSKFSLSERSLGFRWFFSFLLFTKFRRNRSEGGANIFLFDEPAANLHSKAQMKLLDTFDIIAEDCTYIIYSTHSHYMINPLWLEKAYIIANEAIDFEDIDEVDSFAVKETNITAIKYRSFVSQNPTKTSYFQPILDALNVPISPLQSGANALIVEGKFDFYPITYLYKRSYGSDGPVIFPANGAGNAGPLINLFTGWGVDFRILLDDDTAGRKARDRYIKNYIVSSDRVVTLGDIDGSLSGKSFECIYQGDVSALANENYANIVSKKSRYSLLFQELIAQKSTPAMADTLDKFKPIGNWIAATFGANPRPSSAPR